MSNLNQPIITIITACYNSKKTIEQTIQSVLMQTFKQIEYIIIDGASTDDTMKIINKYLDKIDIVVSECDSGVYDAFNKGISLANGKYILFLNSDDYLVDETVIEKIANNLIMENYPIGLYGNIYIINDFTGYVKRFGQEFDIRKISNGEMPPHPGTILLKQVITEFGGFDLNYKIASDFDLIVKVFQKYRDKIFYLPLDISVFRVGGLSSNLNTLPIVKEETLSILKKHFPNNTTEYKVSSYNENENYLMKWLENILIKSTSISDQLIKRDIRSVVIFGSGEFALLIAHDFIMKGIKVIGFLDNDKDRQGIMMNGIKVYSPIWLNKLTNIDAVIYGFLGNHEESVEQQLKSLKIKDSIRVFSWRSLICES